ncbi:MAG: aminopeptidase P N-terminal domain-containing protein, partial [Planctomycetes bacterium]|nr:aminopeptidase P N-terminal domain-containing protein [Planctomycetota bacterium]
MRHVAALLSTLLVSSLLAQEFTPAEFRTRRESVALALRAKQPNGRMVVLVRGAPKAADMGPFVQDADFLWLSGVAEPDLAVLLVIGARGELERDELLVPPFSPFAATWDGRFLAPGEDAAKRTGFRTVGNVRALAETLAEVLAADATGKRPTLFTLFLPAARIGSTP